MKLLPATPGAALPSLEGATLILPAVSIGNVGQLAVDLLIETAAAPRVGRLAHPALLPCAGAGPYSHVPGPAYSMELFQLPGPSASLFIVQQRGPAAPGLQQALADAAAEWAAAAGVARVWLLGSLDAAFRRDDQLQGSQLRFWAADGDAAGATAAGDAAGLAPLEAEWFADKPLEQRLTPPWPLVRACAARGLPCAAVLAFVLEGDNAPDAAAVAGAAATAVPELGAAVGAGGWRRPPSWEHAFGGGPRPVGM